MQEDDLIELPALQHKFINEYLMGLVAQRKAKERQDKEEVIEELKRFTMQEMARGFSLFKETLIVSGGSDSKESVCNA